MHNIMPAALERASLKKELELEHEVQSIETRIKDLEWQMSRAEAGALEDQLTHLASERRRALDKLRETRRELLQVRLDLLEV